MDKKQNSEQRTANSEQRTANSEQRTGENRTVRPTIKNKTRTSNETHANVMKQTAETAAIDPFWPSLTNKQAGTSAKQARTCCDPCPPRRSDSSAPAAATCASAASICRARSRPAAAALSSHLHRLPFHRRRRGDRPTGTPQSAETSRGCAVGRRSVCRHRRRRPAVAAAAGAWPIGD
jgi:hypothetical protein